MKRISLLLSVFFISYGLSAQTVSGIVTDASNSQPMRYVNIGVRGKSTGTVSDGAGKYTLKLKSENGSDTVCFSYLGYETSMISVTDLAARPSADVHLTPAVIDIGTVVIKPARYKRKTVGHDLTEYPMGIIHAGDTVRGFEFGSLLKFKKRARFESIRFNVHDCTYDSMVFRVNVYEQTAGGDFVNILTEPIYAYCTSTNYSKNGTRSITVDVANYDIVVCGNTLVSFEHIEADHTGTISFPIGLLFGCPGYSRRSSQDKWKIFGGDIGLRVSFSISVTALVER